VATLFGVATRIEATCSTASSPAACYSVVYHRNDAMVETAPEQRVPYGVRTRVEVPTGSFDVVWQDANVESTYITGCYDGPTPIDVRNFAARQVED
jgi:hypothetical protein